QTRMSWPARLVSRLPLVDRLAKFHADTLSELRRLHAAQAVILTQLDQSRQQYVMLARQLEEHRGLAQALQFAASQSLPATHILAAATLCYLQLSDGMRFHVMLSRLATDPLSQALRQGIYPCILNEALCDRYLRPGNLVLDL